MSRLPAFSIVSFALVAGSAGAEPSPLRRYRFVYEAPPECPARSAVALRVAEYAPGAELAETAAVVEVHVTVSREGTSYRGTIRAKRQGEPETTRIVPAASCVETVDAAALVVAIFVDPQAGLRAGPQTDAAAPQTTPSGVAESPPPPSAATLPVERTSRVVTEPAAPPRTPQVRAPPGDGKGWAFGAQASVAVTWAISPGASPDFALGLLAEHQGRGLLSPWLALTAHYATSSVTTTDEGRARFRRIAGRASACPLRGWLGASLWAAPCASLEIGRFEGAGEAVDEGHSPDILWAAAGAFGRLAAEFGPWSVAMDLGVAFPLARDRFHFDPERPVFVVPPAGFTAGLGVGASIF